MDDIDKKIVKTLQKNARTSLKNIAQTTFLSSPAVSARIEKMEREKIITGYRAAVDLKKLGYDLTAFISIDVSPAEKIRFYGEMESVSNVLECHCVAGEYSILVRAVFLNTMELDVFMGELQKYGKTSAQIVFSTPVGPRDMDVMAELGEKE
jgi:Lrp/AsnC family leucine-responsive transcriptional regulator